MHASVGGGGLQGCSWDKQPNHWRCACAVRKRPQSARLLPESAGLAPGTSLPRSWVVCRVVTGKPVYYLGGVRLQNPPPEAGVGAQARAGTQGEYRARAEAVAETAAGARGTARVGGRAKGIAEARAIADAGAKAKEWVAWCC